MFYRADGTLVELELNYVEEKTLLYIDEEGVLMHRKIGGTPPCIENHWMVDSVEESLHRLESHGVYPFKDKSVAKLNAKRLGLQSFKYIPVP